MIVPHFNWEETIPSREAEVGLGDIGVSLHPGGTQFIKEAQIRNNPLDKLCVSIDLLKVSYG